jgi:hypothetical protein
VERAPRARPTSLWVVGSSPRTWTWCGRRLAQLGVSGRRHTGRASAGPRGDLGSLSRPGRYRKGWGRCRSGFWSTPSPPTTPSPPLRILRPGHSGAGRTSGPERCLGLLTLRPDRGDRTLLWAETPCGPGPWIRFRRLFVTGLHARALKAPPQEPPHSARIQILRPAHPPGLTEPDPGRRRGRRGGILFGFGNIGGLGETLGAALAQGGRRPWAMSSRSSGY